MALTSKKRLFAEALLAGKSNKAAALAAGYSAASSVPPPPLTPSLPVTPLPAEISQISTSDSLPLLQEVQDWLVDLATWSRSGTPR